ncbi:MAG: hypothetical protein PHF00_12920 [Elusimicrobia bacterium]|nr:hypothetical protein [Elusimicrobiota bacterium]
MVEARSREARDMHEFNRRMFARVGPLAALFLFLYAPCRAAGIKGLAKELSHGASRAAVARVAVLPFEPVDGGASREGRRIA